MKSQPDSRLSMRHLYSGKHLHIRKVIVAFVLAFWTLLSVAVAPAQAETRWVSDVPIMEELEIVVNTWPTSRWLGEQLAKANGISAHVRFPFPGSRLL